MVCIFYAPFCLFSSSFYLVDPKYELFEFSLNSATMFKEGMNGY